MTVRVHAPHGPLATCALQRAIANVFQSRSPARRLRKQLQSSSISVDSLQAAVLAPRQPLAVSSAALRRGVTASAQTGLTGTWKIDKAASDSMDAACDAVQLSWVLRKGLKVLSKLEVEDTPEHFVTRIKAGGIMDVVERNDAVEAEVANTPEHTVTRIKAGGIVDVVERYPWTGEVVLHSRRDKRRGQHRGSVHRTEAGPCIHVEWDNPHGGVCDDTFELSEDGSQLVQGTNMVIRDTQLHVDYKTVYRRA